MPLYRYGGSSLIDEARFIKNATRGVRAYLHAREDATPEQLAETIAGLNRSGFLAVPTEYEGKPVLEVRGFKKADNLLGQLGRMQAIQGTATPTAIKEDKIGFKEWFKHNSFLLTSFIYLAGDAAYIQYEKLEDKIEAANAEKIPDAKIARESYEQKKKEKEKEEEGTKSILPKWLGNPWSWIAGYGYAAGSTTSLIALLLRPDPAEAEISHAAKSAVLGAHKIGIDLEQSDALMRATGNISNVSGWRRSLSKNYSEYMNACFAVAGIAIGRNNYKRRDLVMELQKENPDLANNKYIKGMQLRYTLDTALGAGTFLSGTYGTLMTEKAHDPSKPRQTGLGRIWEWMKERPLAVAANGLLISTVIHLVSSLLERQTILKKNKEIRAQNPAATKHDLLEDKHTKFRLFFVVVNLIAEVIMAFSSKGHGQGVKADASVDTTTCALVAQAIAKNPREQHSMLIDKMATTLSASDSLGTSKDILAKTIQSQLAALDSNPWAMAMATEEKTAKTIPSPSVPGQPLARTYGLPEQPSQEIPQPSVAGQPLSRKYDFPEKASVPGFSAKENKLAEWKQLALTPETASTVGASVH